MRLLTSILIFASWATLAVAGDKDICLGKNQDAYNAIQKFCYGQDPIMVPSTYSKKYQYSGNVFIKIGGESFCDPPQWVPVQYCLSQFYEICANSPQGFGKGHYGRDKCQSFHIGKVTLAV